jgi:hypothetical protein
MAFMFGRGFGYHSMNSTDLLARARKNFNLGRWTNVTRALRILNSRNLTNNQRANLAKLATRAAAMN